MTTDSPEKSYLCETGPHVWPALKSTLENERQALRQIRLEQGLSAAQLEQEHRLRGIDDMNLMERMFAEGQLRDPESARLIERARASYYTLLVPISNLEEERLKELNYVQKSLLTALWQLQQQVQRSILASTTLVITLDLDEANKILRGYQDLSGASPRVTRLVQEIRLILNDLNQLSSQFPK